MADPAATRRERRRAESSLRSRRVRALLASGLVLGIGATVTLAAWNDSEYADGSFTAGTFALEGSTNGTDFSSSGSASPHSLSFSPDSGPLFPGATQYALFSVRSAEDSLGGSVQILAGEDNGAGLGAHLTYGVSVVSGTTCDAAAFSDGTIIVDPESPLTVSADSAQDLSPDQASPVNYCMQIRLPSGADNDAQGQSATPSWEFLGTSVSE